jgi:hypothetical protein
MEIENKLTNEGNEMDDKEVVSKSYALPTLLEFYKKEIFTFFVFIFTLVFYAYRNFCTFFNLLPGGNKSIFSKTHFLKRTVN